jgi:linoleoyl-CoA desaturase
MGREKVRFAPPLLDDFNSVIKARVDSYFQDSNLSKNANFEMFLKSTLYLVAYFSIYSLLVFGGFSVPISVALVLILGFLTAGIGFNIGHDALHGSYSRHQWVNTLMGHTFTIMGAGVFNWKTMHNIVHHSYTNIAEADGDLHPMPWLRFSKDLPRFKRHRFQHWYAPILYCFTSVVWVFMKDYVHLRKPKHMIFQKPPTPRKEFIKLYLGKAAYYCAFLITPLVVMPMAWWQILIGFFLMHFVAGFCLAITFQLGHLVESTNFSSLSAGADTFETWSVHQLRSSANFSMKQPWASWVFGGLNYQIEHHLFPKICHVHYKRLSPIVQRTALEFDLPYNGYDTFSSAVRSHFRYLKALGRDSVGTTHS